MANKKGREQYLSPLLEILEVEDTDVITASVDEGVDSSSNNGDNDVMWQ